MPASFILKNSYPDFPEGTVHILSVNNDSQKDADPLIMYYDRQYFIASDNGALFPIFDQQQGQEIEEPRIYRISRSKDKIKSVFLFTFGELACRIIQGEPLDTIGRKTHNFQKMYLPSPICMEDSIIGTVLYKDSFGNLVTNISYQLFLKRSKNKKRIEIPVGEQLALTTIYQNYSDVDTGEILALFNSMGLLELSQNMGDISLLYPSIERGKIRIDFFDE